jgi:hypothetical protein
MPSRKVHESLDLLVFGRRCSMVHKLLDMPSLWLGPRHRAWLHDETSAILIGYLAGGPEGSVSALLHVWLDKYLPHVEK